MVKLLIKLTVIVLTNNVSKSSTLTKNVITLISVYYWLQQKQAYLQKLLEYRQGILKTGKAKSIRVSTLDAICNDLSSSSEDILELKIKK